MNRSLPIEERCQGYGLLPDVNREDRTIEGSCGTIVGESFEEKIEGTKFLLTETKSLEPSGKCLAVPSELLDIWSPAQVSTAFSLGNLPPLSRHVSKRDQAEVDQLGSRQESEQVPSNRDAEERTTAPSQVLEAIVAFVGIRVSRSDWFSV